MRIFRAAAAASLLIVCTAPLAAADDLTTSSPPDFTFSTGTKVLSANVGQAKTVTFDLVPTDKPSDSQNNCNLKENGTSFLVLDVVVSPVAGEPLATFSGVPSTISMPGCETNVTLSVTATAPGSAMFTFPVDSVVDAHKGVTASDFNTAPATFQVNAVAPDSTPPVIGYTLNPVGPASGWYNGPVAIDWTVTDAQSAISSTTGCADETWSTQTSAAGHTFSCSATSAGGTAGPVNVNVKIDKTAPEVTPIVTGTAGANGWYTSDANVHWNISDALSGLAAGASCPDVPINTDQAATQYDCTVLDVAGNSTTASVTVKRDASAPVITKSVSGAVGANDWYTSNVDVDWTVAEGTSTPVNVTGCVDQTVSDTSGDTLSCSATNDAGLTANDSVALKVDTVAPVVHGAATGPEGLDGWFIGDVAIGWTYDETGSGIVIPCPTGQSQTTDTAGTDFTCQVTDQAGNSSAVETVTVKRDATVPVITPSVDGTEGTNNWYTSDVDVDFATSDATSGLATTVGCDPAPLTSDSASTAYECVATDVAGNSDSVTVTVKRDATAPVISKVITGTPGLAGWYTSTVDVDWTVSEGVSGPVTLVGCADTTVSDTLGTTLSCQATNDAGLEASDSVTVKVDTIAPVVTGEATGTPGNAGWFRGDVTITWSYVEDGSGVTDACALGSQTDDTTGADFTCTVHDAAGNTSNTATVSVKKDAMAPEVSWLTGPADGAIFDFGDSIPASTCSATDATSGVTPAGCTVTGGGTSTGNHTLTAAASDVAGNGGTSTRGYTVRAWTIDGFYRPVTMGDSVVNTVKAGSSVPLKFNVLKNGVKMTSGIGASFTTKKVNCDLTDTPDPVEELATTGGTTLRYDATGAQWIQNWATPSAGKGSCYRVTMTTADGSHIDANFQLK